MFLVYGHPAAFNLLGRLGILCVMGTPWLFGFMVASCDLFDLWGRLGFLVYGPSVFVWFRGASCYCLALWDVSSFLVYGGVLGVLALWGASWALLVYVGRLLFFFMVASCVFWLLGASCGFWFMGASGVFGVWASCGF